MVNMTQSQVIDANFSLRMNDETFDKFRKIIYEKSGVALKEYKKSLLCLRISKRMHSLKINDYENYLKYLLNDESGREIIQLLDVISTNVTEFFRESDHFSFIQNVFRKWLDEGQKRFRFWSAACSTGEEPYSLAIALSEVSRTEKIDLKILATDISTIALEKCKKGEYEEEKIKSMSPPLLNKYFTKYCKGGKNIYRVKDSLKRLIVFKRLNLSETPFPMHGPLDTIFCCNVMIYFDIPVRKKLIKEIYRLLRPEGYLIVGHAESLINITSDFKIVMPSVYLKQ